MRRGPGALPAAFAIGTQRRRREHRRFAAETAAPQWLRGCVLVEAEPAQRRRRSQSSGIIHTMRTTIDSAGRIVIPSDIRNGAGLSAGAVVEIELRDGTITIEPATTPVKIEKRGGLHVAVSEHAEPLTEETVRSTREDLRRR